MQALWQLLWVNPTALSNSAKSVTNNNTLKGHSVEVIQQRVSVVASELLSQVNATFQLFGIIIVPDEFYLIASVLLVCSDSGFYILRSLSNQEIYPIMMHKRYCSPFNFFILYHLLM